MLLHAWITGNPSVPNPITTRRMSMTLKESGGRMLRCVLGTSCSRALRARQQSIHLCKVLCRSLIPSRNWCWHRMAVLARSLKGGFQHGHDVVCA